MQGRNEHEKQEESNNHPQGNQVQLGPPGGINPNFGEGAPGGVDPGREHQQFPEEKNSESPDQLLIVENADLNKRVEALQSELLALNSCLEEIQAALTEAVTSQQNLEVMLATVSQGKNQAEGDNIQLRQGLEELNNRLATVLQERDEAASRNVKLHQDLGKLQAILAENQLLKNELEGVKSRIDEFGQKLEVAKAEIQSQKKQKADLERRMGAQLEEERERSAEARHAKPELEKRVQELQKEVERSARENAQLRKENNKLNEEKGNLDYQLRQAKLHGEDMQKSKEVVDENLLKMTQLQEETEKTKKVSDRTIKALNQTLETTQKQNNDLNALVETLEQQLEVLQRENNDLRAQAMPSAAAVEAKEQHQDKVSDLKQQLDNVKSRHLDELISMQAKINSEKLVKLLMLIALVFSIGLNVRSFIGPRRPNLQNASEPSDPLNASAVVLVTGAMRSAAAQLTSSVIPELTQAVLQRIGEFVSTKTNASSTACVFEVGDATAVGKAVVEEQPLLEGNAENEFEALDAKSSPIDIYNQASAFFKEGKLKEARSKYISLLQLKNDETVQRLLPSIRIGLGRISQTNATSFTGPGQEKLALKSYRRAVKNYEEALTYFLKGNRENSVDEICDHLLNIMDAAPHLVKRDCIEKMTEAYKGVEKSKILDLHALHFKHLDSLDIITKDPVENVRARYALIKFGKRLASLLEEPEYKLHKDNYHLEMPLNSEGLELELAVIEILTKHGVPLSLDQSLDDLLCSAVKQNLGEEPIGWLSLLRGSRREIRNINDPIAIPVNRGKAIEFIPLLHGAAFLGNINSMKALLEAGADINQVATNQLATDEQLSFLKKDPSQIVPISKLAHSGTPLHYAVSNLQKEVIEFLIANGAHLNVKNDGGLTPQDLAKKTGAEHIIQLLENAQTQKKGIAALAGKVGFHAQQDERPLGGNVAAADAKHNANHQGFKQVVAPGPTMS